MYEIWKDIHGYEGHYQVSNLGRVRSLDRIVKYSNGRDHFAKGRIIKPGTCRGYRTAGLHVDGQTKKARISRLVAEHFVDNPHNYPHVNHKDENKENDCADNLEWCTPEYNNAYGTRVRRSHESAEKNQRQFVCVETLTIYRSESKCARELNLLQTGVNNVLKHRAKSHKGFHFMFLDEMYGEDLERLKEKGSDLRHA